MRFQGRLWLALPLCLVVLIGCGKKSNAPASWTGTVTYNGKPVTGGMISLYAKDAGLYAVPIGADGNFSATQVPEGEVSVAVETESINPNKPTYGGAMGKGMDFTPQEAKANRNKGTYVPIPRKYANPSTSGLKMTLTKGKIVQNLDLKN